MQPEFVHITVEQINFCFGRIIVVECQPKRKQKRIQTHLSNVCSGDFSCVLKTKSSSPALKTKGIKAHKPKIMEYRFSNRLPCIYIFACRDCFAALCAPVPNGKMEAFAAPKNQKEN